MKKNQLKSKVTNEEKREWQHKDFSKDSILGISSDSVDVFLKNKKREDIIVAVIDLEVNISHKDLKNSIH